MFHPDDPRNETALDRLINPKPCTWNEDADGVWFSCDAPEGGRNAFTFEVGDPEDNDFKFCPYCGKPLIANPCTEFMDAE